jgi:hypothetical protein
VSRDGSPVTATLTTVHSALAERCLVDTGSSDLSALAGVRARTIGVTLSTKK